MDFSEIGAAARLLRGILERGGRTARAQVPARARPAEPAPSPEPAPVTRAARLERILAALCATPGVQSAVLADDTGLPLAGFGLQAGGERLAAFSSMLGTVMDGARRVLGEEAGDRVTLRLSGDLEAVVTRFSAEGRTYHLVVQCSGRAAARADLRGAAAALRGALGGPVGSAEP